MTDHQANDIYQSLRIGIYIATEKPFQHKNPVQIYKKEIPYVVFAKEELRYGYISFEDYYY